MAQRHRKLLLSHVGPGGLHCPCCGPAPSHRASLLRAIKRRERAIVRKEIEQELADIGC